MQNGKGQDRSSDRVTPYRLSVPEETLVDLRRRLEHARWPEPEPVSDGSQGVQLSKLRALCEYWRTKYDWRRTEVALNAFGQFRTTIFGLGIHFLHIRSPEPAALPVVMTHGWPGSVLEFHKVIDPLTDPRRHGGDPRDAFHLVIPSLPGFGFSDKPTETGWGLSRIADALAELMRRLGYGERWAAQGGDWGGFVSTTIAAKGPRGCVGVHTHQVAVTPTQAEIANASPEEEDALARFQRYEADLSGYAKTQATRPQTIGYALTDSPIGQAAWIYEKFQEWTDHSGAVEDLLSMDEILDAIMLYWLPGAAASSARLYWESADDMSDTGKSRVPIAFTVFPKDIVGGSHRWAERQYGRVDYWNEVERGGHFAAMEQPDIFVREVRAGFRAMRGR